MKRLIRIILPLLTALILLVLPTLGGRTAMAETTITRIVVTNLDAPAVGKKPDYDVSVNATGWGVGVWGDNRPMLDQLRRRMAADPKGVMHLISSCDLPERGLAFGGRQFKRIDVPANISAMLLPWYRAKEIYVAKAEPDYHLIYQPELVSALAEDFTALAPVYHLLRGAADLSE